MAKAFLASKDFLAMVKMWVRVRVWVWLGLREAWKRSGLSSLLGLSSGELIAFEFWTALSHNVRLWGTQSYTQPYLSCYNTVTAYWLTATEAQMHLLFIIIII